MKSSWIRYVLLILIVEKTIQHLFVTVALYLDWGDIRSTVVLSPDPLMVLGLVVAVMFAVSFWGILTRQRWATGLVMALALFDIVGEFLAQGRLDIAIPISFIVASLLLVLAFLSWRSQ
jgi:hypothetical protein